MAKDEVGQNNTAQAKEYPISSRRHNQPTIIWWLPMAVAMFVGTDIKMTLPLPTGSRGRYGTVADSGMERCRL